jgi:hypothetical protein
LRPGCLFGAFLEGGGARVWTGGSGVPGAELRSLMRYG